MLGPVQPSLDDPRSGEVASTFQDRVEDDESRASAPRPALPPTPRCDTLLLMDRDAIEQALSAYLTGKARDVYAAYLFGSVARGTARPDSDVDVAVLLDAGRPKTLAEMPTALQQDLTLLLGRPVDLVVLDGAPPDLVHRVLRDGRLILDRDRSRRIAFEVRARNVYFDMRPILDEYRRLDRGVA